MKVINFRDGTDPFKGPPGYSHSFKFPMTLSTGKEGPRAGCGFQEGRVLNLGLWWRKVPLLLWNSFICWMEG